MRRQYLAALILAGVGVSRTVDFGAVAGRMLVGARVVAVYVIVADSGRVALIERTAPAEERIGHLGKGLVVSTFGVVSGAAHRVLPSVESRSIWVQNVLGRFIFVATNRVS
jgi:hypothetical protein